MDDRFEGRLAGVIGDAVDVKADGIAMAPGEVKLVRNPVAHLFLESSRFAAVASGPIQHQFVFPEEKVVVPKGDAVPTAAAGGAAIARGNIGAPLIAGASVVNDPLVAEHEGYIVVAVV